MPDLAHYDNNEHYLAANLQSGACIDVLSSLLTDSGQIIEIWWSL